MCAELHTSTRARISLGISVLLTRVSSSLQHGKINVPALLLQGSKSPILTTFHLFFCLNARPRTMCKLFHPDEKSVGRRSACELGGLDILINNSMSKNSRSPSSVCGHWAFIRVNWGVGINFLEELYSLRT